MEEHKDEISKQVLLLEYQVQELRQDAKNDIEIKRRVADAIEKRFLVSEDRVRDVERTIWKAAGAITVIGALVVIAVNIIMKHL